MRALKYPGGDHDTSGACIFIADNLGPAGEIASKPYRLRFQKSLTYLG